MDSCVASAPGAGPVRFLAVLRNCVTNPRILNIRIAGDPVSSIYTTGFQTGRRTEYSAPRCGINPSCRHGIATHIQQVRRDAANFLELSLRRS
jgi:hypothetical protein